LNLLDEILMGWIELLSEVDVALRALFRLKAFRLVASGVVSFLQDHP
jgi:hypothetical protein